MKILAFGFGMTPLFIKPLKEKLDNEEADVEFSVLLSSSHHLKLMSDLLGKDNVLCIDLQLPKYKNAEVEFSELSNYTDNIYKNIESQKVTMKNRDSSTQMNIA